MIATVSSQQAIWYLTRSTGLVALLLLTASVVLGVTEVTRWASAQFPRFVTAALHRNVSLLAVAFVGVHVAGAVLDGYAPIGWLDAIIPFRSPYRPLWLGLGALAFDMLIALILTSLLRRRIGQNVWRFVHWLAYACWPVAFVHGLGTGSDSRVGWSFAFSLAMLALVVGAVAWRLVAIKGTPPTTRAWLGVGAALVAVTVLAWAYTGPAQRGWARRAGTPLSLIGSNAQAAASVSPVGLHAPFTAALQGTLRQQSLSNGKVTLTIACALSNGRGSLVVELRGSPTSGGGIFMDAGTATLESRSQSARYDGPIELLDGSSLRARVRDASGNQLHLSISLAVDATSNAVTGNVTATRGDD